MAIQDRNTACGWRLRIVFGIFATPDFTGVFRFNPLMKGRFTIPAAIGCSALIMPKFLPANAAAGGAIVVARATCDSKADPLVCVPKAGGTCTNLDTTETTDQWSQQRFVASDVDQGCSEFCTGVAAQPSDDCDKPKRPSEDPIPGSE